MPRRILESKPMDRRIRGRPRKRWLKDVAKDIQSMGIRVWRKLSKERTEWKKITEKMQQYADIYLLLNYSACFGRPSRPPSGVHKTVVAASGTDHTIWEASFLKRDQIRTQFWSRLRKLDSQIL